MFMNFLLTQRHLYTRFSSLQKWSSRNLISSHLFALLRSSMRSSECLCRSELFLVTLSSVSRRFSTRCLNSASLDEEEDDDPVGLGSGQIKNHMTLLLRGRLN